MKNCYLFIFFVILFLFTGSCKKEEFIVPIVETLYVFNITDSSAFCAGTIKRKGIADITTRGFCWGIGKIPTIADNKTSDVADTGFFISKIPHLKINTYYAICAYASNDEDTWYGKTLVFFTGIKDVDGNNYSIVKIGKQWWMKENLKVIRYNDGTAIPVVTNNAAWELLNTPAYCWYNNDAAANYYVYGALYNWYTVNTGKLCPVDWHVPSDSEWAILKNQLGSGAGGKLKEAGTAPSTGRWASPNTGATNESGFTARPGGVRRGDYKGLFGNKTITGAWWSSTGNSELIAFGCSLWYMDDSLRIKELNDKRMGLSIRCVKD